MFVQLALAAPLSTAEHHAGGHQRVFKGVTGAGLHVGQFGDADCRLAIGVADAVASVLLALLIERERRSVCDGTIVGAVDQREPAAE